MFSSEIQEGFRVLSLPQAREHLVGISSRRCIIVLSLVELRLRANRQGTER